MMTQKEMLTELKNAKVGDTFLIIADGLTHNSKKNFAEIVKEERTVFLFYSKEMEEKKIGHDGSRFSNKQHGHWYVNKNVPDSDLIFIKKADKTPIMQIKVKV